MVHGNQIVALFDAECDELRSHGKPKGLDNDLQTYSKVQNKKVYCVLLHNTDYLFQRMKFDRWVDWNPRGRGDNSH